LSTPQEFESMVQKYMATQKQTPAEKLEGGRAMTEPLPTGEEDSVSFTGEVALPMIAPALLGMLGRGATMAGSAAFPPAAGLLMNPATQAGVQAAAGYGGRKINQALGLEGEGMWGDIASAAVPGAFEVGGALLKGGAKGLMKRSTVGREALEEQAIERTRGLADKFVAAPSEQQVSALYANAHAAGAKVPTQKIKAAAKTRLTGYQEFEALGQKQVVDRPSQKLLEEANNLPGQISMENMTRLRTRYLEEGRLAAKSAEKGSGERSRALFALADSFDDALDDAVNSSLTNPAQRDALQMARDGHYKRQIADEMNQILEGKIRTTKDGMTEVVSIGAIKDALRTGKTHEAEQLRKYLQRTNQTDSFVKELNAIGETIKKPIRIDLASIPMMGVGGAAAGAYAGPMLGMSPVVGAAAGSALGGLGTAGIQYTFARLLASSPGRRLVAHTLAATDGVITPTAWSIFQNAAKAPGIGQLAGAGLRQPFQEPQ
jgi:hypothetical protein